MSDIVIRVENLGKRYRIGALQNRHDTLRDQIADSRLQIANSVSRVAKSVMRRTNGNSPSANSVSPSAGHIWALKDVSFEVKRGEVVGIIGRNGAGKSTLLKILSRITKPTEGCADIHGRVGSLLEVGTGFHPELTGRENIYLNGAILGMHRVDIERKFDEIVAFAEVEKFIDTPVKRYSSGMYVRLAFAVAAHLEPEILLVDEVLSVGDAAFQKKCLGKMGDVAKEGRTVLFVSHNIGAVARICDRGIYIENGQILFDGSTETAIASYTRNLAGTKDVLVHRDIELRVDFLSIDGTRLVSWQYDNQLLVRVHLQSKSPLRDLAVDLAFYSPAGARVFAVQSDAYSAELSGLDVRGCDFEFRIRNMGLACTELTVDLGIRTNRESRYLVWWQRIETIPVSISGFTREKLPDMLIWMPCEVGFSAIS